MNKDKAIQLLERLQDPEPYEPMLTKDAYDAIQMAIDALSADGDTISRASLMSKLRDMHHEAEKWIADAKNDDVKARAESCLVTITEIKLRVDKMPSVQPEIIRCKDCKHRDPEDKKCDCGHDIEWQLPRQDDWFCADAER